MRQDYVQYDENEMSTYPHMLTYFDRTFRIEYDHEQRMTVAWELRTTNDGDQWIRFGENKAWYERTGVPRMMESILTKLQRAQREEALEQKRREQEELEAMIPKQKIRLDISCPSPYPGFYVTEPVWLAPPPVGLDAARSDDV